MCKCVDRVQFCRRSESVLNSAVRKLPPELRSKWFFHISNARIVDADFMYFSTWLSNVAFVHDEMNLQFGSINERKPFSKDKSTARNNSSTFAAKVENDFKALPSCPLKDGSHRIWNCSKFKEQTVTERYETAKRLKLCFCCLDGSYPIKDCKSTRTCGVNGCTKKHNRLLHSESRKPRRSQKMTKQMSKFQQTS